MKMSIKRQKAVTDAKTAILHSDKYPSTREVKYVTIEKRTLVSLLDGLAELDAELAQLAQFVATEREGKFSQK